MTTRMGTADVQNLLMTSIELPPIVQFGIAFGVDDENVCCCRLPMEGCSKLPFPWA